MHYQLMDPQPPAVAEVTHCIYAGIEAVRVNGPGMHMVITCPIDLPNARPVKLCGEWYWRRRTCAP